MINYTEDFIIVGCMVASVRTMLLWEKASGQQQFSSKRGAALQLHV